MVKIIIPKQDVKENFVNSIFDLYRQIEKEKFSIANSAVLFHLFISEKTVGKKLLEELLSYSNPITSYSFIANFLEKSQIYDSEGRILNGNYVIHNPKLKDGNIFVSDSLEAIVVPVESFKEYKGSFKDIPENLFLALTGFKKHSYEGKKLLEMLSDVYVNLESRIFDPLNPELLPVTFTIEGKSIAKVTNYYGRETMFNVRYLKAKYQGL